MHTHISQLTYQQEGGLYLGKRLFCISDKMPLLFLQLELQAAVVKALGELGILLRWMEETL